MLDSLNNQYVLAAGRILLVLIYFIGGFGLLTGDIPIDYAASKGLPTLHGGRSDPAPITETG